MAGVRAGQPQQMVRGGVKQWMLADAPAYSDNSPAFMLAKFVLQSKPACTHTKPAYTPIYCSAAMISTRVPESNNTAHGRTYFLLSCTCPAQVRPEEGPGGYFGQRSGDHSAVTGAFRTLHNKIGNAKHHPLYYGLNGCNSLVMIKTRLAGLHGTSMAAACSSSMKLLRDLSSSGDAGQRRCVRPHVRGRGGRCMQKR